MNGNHEPDDTDDYWSSFTSNAADYELGAAIGFGASATVYSAIFTPPPLLSTPSSSTASHDTSAESTTPTPTPTVATSRQGRPDLSITVPSLPSSSKHEARVDTHGGSDKEGGMELELVLERPCAVKVSSSHPDVEQMIKEIRMLSLCQHPNVLRILATFTLPPDQHRIAIVTPLITGGSLAGILEWRSRLSSTPKHHHFSFLKGTRHRRNSDEEEIKGRLEEEEIKAVVKQVLQGLEYLHGAGFLHRDLKAGNLLIDEDGTVLLADFGVGGDMNAPPSPVVSQSARPTADQLRFDETSARTGLGPGKSNSSGSGNVAPASAGETNKRKSFVGTPNWMAPEVVTGQKYDTKADLWSLGMTILELAHGSVPGSKSKPNDVLARIVTAAAPTLDRTLGHSKQMKEFVGACLVKEPHCRPTAAQLSEHPWLKGAKKKPFLAQSLLSDVPPLFQRQELRRVPTMSSLISRASSWDFSTTPAPSMPSSPIRSSLLLSTRSPSVISHSGAGEYFSIGRSHSRNSSFSHNMLPPSPRVSLRQWAEQSADHVKDAPNHLHTGGVGLSARTGSERGKSRSSSAIRDKSVRLGKSASFDIQRGRPRSTADNNAYANGSYTSLTPSPSATKREPSSLRQTDDVISTKETVDPSPLTPLMEVTMGQNQVGISALKLEASETERTGEETLYSSPESVSTLADAIRQVKTGDVPDTRQRPSRSPTADAAVDRPVAATSTTIPRPRQRAEDLRPEGQNDLAVRPSSSPSNTVLEKAGPAVPVEKKNWLGRKASVKKTGGKNAITGLGIGMGPTAAEREKERGDDMDQGMGRTASWTGVLGKVAGKIHKR